MNLCQTFCFLRSALFCVGLAVASFLIHTENLAASDCVKARDITSGLPPNEYQVLYAQTLAEVKSNLRSAFKDLKDIKLNVSNERIKYGFTHGVNLIIETVDNRTIELNNTYGFFNLSDLEMQASFQIEASLQRKGISKLMTLRILSDHPQIRVYSASLTQLNRTMIIVSMATNVNGPQLEALIEPNVGGGEFLQMAREDFLFELTSLEGKESVKSFRKRLIASTYETPALRLRKSIGFHRLSKINIIRLRDGISLQIKVEKGSRISDDAIEVAYQNTIESSVIHLRPDGYLQKYSFQ